MESSAHGERHKDLISVKMRETGIENTLKFIENTWKRFVPGSTLEFSFLSEDLSRLYEREKKSGKIAWLFSLLAVFISCLGLLGMSSFMLEQRSKEITVRKILGASFKQIVMMLSRDFLKWVLVANAVAWPVAYIAMDKWLQDFAYRVSMNAWMFIFSALAILSIAFFTISFQTFKAAVANPVDSLKYE
jgi:putative ABC transport system permease protein